MAPVQTYLHALGMLSAMGNNADETYDSLLNGARPGMEERSGILPEAPVFVGAVQTQLPEIPASMARYRCRNSQLVLAALQQIEAEVRAQIEKYGPHRVGVVVGSSTAGIAEGETALAHKLEHGTFPPGFYYDMQEIGSVGHLIAEYLGLTTVARTISTACSSSARVMASARALIEMNLCDAVIVGGADSLCRLTVNGFTALESVSQKICNPMSKNRDGITIGEGAALFVLSREPGPIALRGVGESTDAYHISSPEPQGTGAEAAMRMALEQAGLEPGQIDYVNLHGTATILNDQMESRAVERVFGTNTPSSSTKSLTGHTLGAAGAIEAGLCWLALSRSNQDVALPPHVWDESRDEELPEIRLVGAQERLPNDSGLNFMSNSFAFGGNNCAVIIGHAGDGAS